jgi:hypothetical protein
MHSFNGNKVAHDMLKARLRERIRRIRTASQEKINSLPRQSTRGAWISDFMKPSSMGRWFELFSRTHSRADSGIASVNL